MRCWGKQHQSRIYVFSPQLQVFCPGAEGFSKLMKSNVVDLHLGAQNLLDRFLISLNCTGGKKPRFFKDISGHTHVTGGYFTGGKSPMVGIMFFGI